MIIYQVHQYSNEYEEDYYDRIVGSYLNREKAENLKNCLVLKQNEDYKQSLICHDCPIYDDDLEVPQECLLVKTQNYCNNFDPTMSDSGDSISCKNSKFCCFGRSEFDVKEVKVEE